MKKDLKNLESILDPSLWGRIFSKAWLIIIMFILFAVVFVVGVNQLIPSEVIDRAWLLSKQHEVQALDLEIKAAREALDRHKVEVKERSGFLSFSHSDDREESERLNNEILNLERRRIELVRKFNTERSAFIGDETGLLGIIGEQNE